MKNAGLNWWFRKHGNQWEPVEPVVVPKVVPNPYRDRDFGNHLKFFVSMRRFLMNSIQIGKIGVPLIFVLGQSNGELSIKLKSSVLLPKTIPTPNFLS